MKITNNQGMVMELDEKAIEILSIVYTVGDYRLQKGKYDKAEDFLIKNGYVLWEIFGGILKPNETFMNPIPEMLSQRKDTPGTNKVLDNLFGKHEKKSNN